MTDLEQDITNWIEANTGLVVAFGALVIALVVLVIVAMWILFKKAGEPGWKSIIPFYNIYILCKIVWDKNIFWIWLAIALGGGILVSAIGGEVGTFVQFACSIADLVISIILLVKTSFAYGRGAGTAVGLIFLPTIFTLILAFGSAKYVGPQNKNA